VHSRSLPEITLNQYEQSIADAALTSATALATDILRRSASDQS
jgi:hypothetical protein